MKLHKSYKYMKIQIHPVYGYMPAVPNTCYNHCLEGIKEGVQIGEGGIYAFGSNFNRVLLERKPYALSRKDTQLIHGNMCTHPSVPSVGSGSGASGELSKATGNLQDPTA
jgi:hypothetical protein